MNQTNPTGNTYYTLTDYMSAGLGVKSYSAPVPFFLSLVDENGVPKPMRLSPTDPLAANTEVMAIKLIVNPSTTSLNLAKIINRTQTMTAWVEEHWGEEIDVITLQGSTAAFVVGGPNLRSIRSGGPLTEGIAEGQRIRSQFNSAAGIDDMETSTPAGLTMRARRDTVSFRQMKAMLALMRSNGNTFDPEYNGLVSGRLRVMLTFDFGMYVGWIESFDVTEEAGAPFRFTYTITFKSEKTTFYYTGLR